MPSYTQISQDVNSVAKNNYCSHDNSILRDLYR